MYRLKDVVLEFLSKLFKIALLVAITDISKSFIMPSEKLESFKTQEINVYSNSGISFLQFSSLILFEWTYYDDLLLELYFICSAILFFKIAAAL